MLLVREQRRREGKKEVTGGQKGFTSLRFVHLNADLRRSCANWADIRTYIVWLWTLTVTPFPLLNTNHPLSLPIYLPPSPPLCLPLSSLSLSVYLLFFHLPIMISSFHPSEISLSISFALHHPPLRVPTSLSFSISALLTIHLHTPHLPPLLSLCSHCSVSNGSAPSQQIHQAEAGRAAAPTNASQPLDLSRLTAGWT